MNTPGCSIQHAQGLTPFNMGGPDEYVLVDELVAVAKIHTLVAYDFLSAEQ